MSFRRWFQNEQYRKEHEHLRMELTELRRRCSAQSDPKPEFQFVISSVQKMVKKQPDRECKLAVIDFAIQAIKLDLASSSYTQLFYTEPESYSAYSLGLFFDSSTADFVPVDLSQVTVISAPWNPGRLAQAVLDIRQMGLRPELNSIDALYIPELELLFVENGRHHMAAAAVERTGRIEALRLSFEALLPSLRADAEGWYWPESKKRIPVRDPRPGILFELYRLRRQLSK